MWSWIVDQIPWWVYLIGGMTVVGGLFYFFSPILVPLWNITPRWLKVALGGIGAAFLAWTAGRNRGAHDAAELQRRNDANAINNRNEVNQSVQNASPAERDKRLERWMRD